MLAGRIKTTPLKELPQLKGKAAGFEILTLNAFFQHSYLFFVMLRDCKMCTFVEMILWGAFLGFLRPFWVVGVTSPSQFAPPFNDSRQSLKGI